MSEKSKVFVIGQQRKADSHVCVQCMQASNPRSHSATIASVRSDTDVGSSQMCDGVEIRTLMQASQVL